MNGSSECALAIGENRTHAQTCSTRGPHDATVRDGSELQAVRLRGGLNRASIDNCQRRIHESRSRDEVVFVHKDSWAGAPANCLPNAYCSASCEFGSAIDGQFPNSQLARVFNFTRDAPC